MISPLGGDSLNGYGATGNQQKDEVGGKVLPYVEVCVALLTKLHFVFNVVLQIYLPSIIQYIRR